MQERVDHRRRILPAHEQQCAGRDDLVGDFFLARHAVVYDRALLELGQARGRIEAEVTHQLAREARAIADLARCVGSGEEA